jgi:uncharacterized phage protein gp47/JayE
MSITAPDERKFKLFKRGEIRDGVILRAWRNSLRAQVNPETGLVFTEDEISRATQRGSRFYMEADAIDLLGQSQQGRSMFLVNQMRPNRSNGEFLMDYHSELWLGANALLPATGGSGTVNAPATVGSIFVGSTTIGDPAAAVATDPAGKRYQVLTTVVTPVSGTAALNMQAVDVGSDTNPLLDTVFKWVANQPPGAETEAVVTSSPRFTGGFDEETDSDHGDRIEQRMRNKPACGNNAHWVDWARQATVAVEAAFVYPIAFNAGSVLVAVTQKRSTDPTALEGPLVRAEPSAGTLSAVTNYITPPASPVVPQRVYVVVTAPNAQYANSVLRISMAQGSDGGWADTTPWPNPSETTGYPDVQVTNVVTPDVVYEFETDSDPAGTSPLTGDDVPSLMVWNRAQSRWEELEVTSLAWAGTTKTITLTSAPSFTIAVGDRISPFTNRLDDIAVALEDYFDGLGPGQVIDLTTDPRAARGYRYPTVSEQYPLRAGQAITSAIIDALGGLAPDAQLDQISRNEPDLPGDIVDGPNMVVLGHVNIYPFAV